MFAPIYVPRSKLVETKMDKSWIDSSRMLPEYEKGVIKFVNFAIKNVEDARNLTFHTPTIVTEHLY